MNMSINFVDPINFTKSEHLIIKSKLQLIKPIMHCNKVTFI